MPPELARGRGEGCEGFAGDDKLINMDPENHWFVEGNSV